MEEQGRDEVPDALRPYLWHGVDLQWRAGDKQAEAECPFCGKRKFYVEVETGLWRCFVCGTGGVRGGGNAYTFLRELWDASDRATNGQTKVLAADRRLMFPETLTHWGACVSVLTGDWLVAGYGADGRITQLYRYVRNNRKKRMDLLPTPGMDASQPRHGLFGVSGYDREKPDVILCEGPWDGMAVWEVVRSAKGVGGRNLEYTASHEASLLSTTNVLAVPGCTTFPESWAGLLVGKRVTVMYDSDHPSRQEDGRTAPPAGWSGMKRLAGLLASLEQSKRPAEVRVLWWGDEGYDPSHKHGYDVRDALTGSTDVKFRVAALQGLLARVRPVPKEWVTGDAVQARRRAEIPVLKCGSWQIVLNEWRKAMRMRKSMEDVLAVSLAVCASTMQQGDQLFLQMIGDAGSGKTRFCDALLTSKNCHALEHMTGFHSGVKDDSGDDYSLLARINGKTLVTPEGDVMMSSPHFPQIMSQQRRIFDGTSGATYKNRKEDMRYSGLRTPWIIAGTPALMDTDQSRLGDRFLRVVMAPPEDGDRREILRHVAYSSLRSVRRTADGSAGGGLDGPMLTAYRLTGGYVDHLRENAEKMLSAAEFDEEAVAARCMAWGEFVAVLRARPNPDPRKDEGNDSAELPTRLTSQFVRLASCLTVVLQRKTADEEVMRIVEKVALDTGRGVSADVLRSLHGAGQDGQTSELASYLTKRPGNRVRQILEFLRRIGAAEKFQHKATPRHVRGETRWRMTGRMWSLYEEVSRVELS